jgi:flagellar biosynthesis protein FlhB
MMNYLVVASSVAVVGVVLVTVRVTVLSPKFSHVKIVSGIDRVISEQASEEFLLISAAVNV